MYRMDNQYNQFSPYGNDRPLFPHYSRPREIGNQKSSETFDRHLSQMDGNRERLAASVSRHEKELEDMKAKKKELEEKVSKISECQKMMFLWTGLDIVKSSEQECNVAFPVFRKGKEYGRYTIGFRKVDKFWIVHYHSLPVSMKMVPQRMKNAQINNTDKLVNMICKLQSEIYLFNRRGEQFEEAKALENATLRIHPSLNTLSVMIEVYIEDMSGSDLSSVFVQLSYQPDKFLPEGPQFSFQGGTKEDREELKSQLACLEHMPLKDALISSFNMDASTISNTPSDCKQEDNCQPAEVSKLKDIKGRKIKDDVSIQESDSNSSDAAHPKSKPLSSSESSPPPPPPLFEPPVKRRTSMNTAKRGSGFRGRGNRGTRARGRK